MTYDDIEDALGGDVVRRLERSFSEGWAAAAAAYPDGGPRALELLILMQLASVLTGFAQPLDSFRRAEGTCDILKAMVLEMMARTDLPDVETRPQTARARLS